MAFNLYAVYMKSPFVHVVRDSGFAVIWHSLFGYPKVVPAETLEFLELFSKPATIHHHLGDELTSEDWEMIAELLRCYFLVPEDFDDRVFLEERMREQEKEIVSGSLIDYLELIMSEACNFRCTYCIHFNNLETSDRINNPKKFMRFEIAKETVDRYLDILRDHGKRVAEINFGGGEPLLAWLVIKQVLEYCHAVYGKEFGFRFSINTNASLITQNIAKTLKEYRVEIASSLDGLREGNDRVRLTKSGGGTFSQIMCGFDALTQVGYPLDGMIQLGSLLEIQSFHAPGTAYHCFVRDHLTGVMDMCKGCMIEGQCGGGCNITQEFARATKTAKIERMCDFYRRTTQEILREQLREATVSEPALLQPATERR